MDSSTILRILKELSDDEGGEKSDMDISLVMEPMKFVRVF